ncbi:MAG TPA: RNA 2',3'-cyclic phosphodiesterase [Candidatus Baltobacteraceae bacterium]|nr:RNA 2',3'-cyclic phosphodiesterase [Candidatus Baltobacteraceae bacterium]
MPYRPKLFAGIALDKRVRTKCANVASRLAAQGLDARFEPAEKLHITLAFLGWVDPERVEPIVGALDAAANNAVPFTLTLDTLGAFPHERRPKIVWIGSRDQGALYRRLAYGTRAAFEQVGFSFDKDAVAHVTIARIKGARGHLPLIDVPPMHVHVTDIVLFESLPAGPTTRYEVLARAALNPNA